MKLKFEKFFKFGDLKTTFKKEIIGGTTSFLSCLYILSVNPALVSQSPSITNDGDFMGAGGIFLATALLIILSTFIMGLFANSPMILAPSMALNAMFVFQLSMGSKLGYEGALIACMIASILFTIISVTPIRSFIIKSMPQQLHYAISIAIGFFIAYVGLSQMGLLEKSSGGLPIAKLGSIKDNYPTMLIAIFTLMLMFFFHVRKIKGGMIFAVLIGLVPALILANIASIKDLDIIGSSDKLGAASWKGWNYSDFSTFGSNIKNTWAQISNNQIWVNSKLYVSIFVIVLLCFFDATGTINSLTLIVNEKSNNVDSPVNRRALMVDSFSTIIGSSLGTTPSNAYIESATGIAAGARSGFSSIFASGLFLLAIPLFPLFQMIPGSIAATSCVFVGSLMVSQITKIDWKDYSSATTAFMMILFMIATYSITDGIGAGIIFYCLIEVAKGNIKQIKPTMWIIILLFFAYFISLFWMQ